MEVVIGLGSNVGDRLAHLRQAVQRIDLIACARVVARSHVYESAAVGDGPPQQGAFLNAAVLVEWNGELLPLLDALNVIEHDLGRTREVHHGPRTIDLDILLAEDVVVDTARLKVPHAHLHERAFAVAPLLDVMPDAIDPKTKTRYVIPAGGGDDVTRFSAALEVV